MRSRYVKRPRSVKTWAIVLDRANDNVKPARHPWPRRSAHANKQIAWHMTRSHDKPTNVPTGIVVMQEGWNERAEQIFLPLVELSGSTICDDIKLVICLTGRESHVLQREPASLRFIDAGVYQRKDICDCDLQSHRLHLFYHPAVFPIVSQVGKNIRSGVSLDVFDRRPNFGR